MLQELTAYTKTITTAIMGKGGMTNLWLSLLYNPYQAAQHKHIFCLCKVLNIKKLQKYIAVSNFFAELLNDCQKKLTH